MGLDDALARLAGEVFKVAAHVEKAGPLPVAERPGYEPDPAGGAKFSVEHVPDWAAIARRFVDVEGTGGRARSVLDTLKARVRDIGTESAKGAADAPDTVQAVLVAFLADALTLRATPEREEVAITTALDRLGQFLSGDPIQCELLTPLANVELASDTVELLDGACIREFAPADKETFWRAHGITLGGSRGVEGLTRFEVIRAQAAIAVPVDVEGFSMLGWGASQEIEAQVVTALQIFGSRKPRSGVTYLAISEPLRPYTGLAGDVGLLSYFRPLGPSRAITLSPSTGAEMRDWLSWYRSRPPDAAIDTAIRRVEQSDARPLPEDRLIDCWIALEALFLGRDEQIELNYRVSVRIAQFLGETAAQRLELQRNMKASYGMRSRVVHGAPPAAGTPKAAALDQLLARTEDALGSVLRTSRRVTMSRKELLAALDESLLTGLRDASWPGGG